MNRESIENFRRVISWARRNKSIRSLLLTGSTNTKLWETHRLPHYQITVVANDLEFLEVDSWISDIQEFLVCLYDHQDFGAIEIDSRVILFKGGSNIQFLFVLASQACDLFTSGLISRPLAQSFKTLLNKDSSYPFQKYCAVNELTKQDLIHRATKILN